MAGSGRQLRGLGSCSGWWPYGEDEYGAGSIRQGAPYHLRPYILMGFASANSDRETPAARLCTLAIWHEVTGAPRQAMQQRCCRQFLMAPESFTLLAMRPERDNL
jgi:hypothetical protein